MITAYIHDTDLMIHREQMSVKDIVKLRNELRGQAFLFLSSHDDDHVVYYYDVRDEEDNIKEAHFYYMMPGLSDEQFYERTKNITGFIGAVHRHK